MSRCKTAKFNKSEIKSSSLFRFVDGVDSLKQVKIPVLIGQQELLLDVDVVGNEIPFLISKPTMTKMGIKIDFLKHEITIGSQRIKLMVIIYYCFCQLHIKIVK